jgi:hypothetical protein
MRAVDSSTQANANRSARGPRPAPCCWSDRFERSSILSDIIISLEAFEPGRRFWFGRLARSVSDELLPALVDADLLLVEYLDPDPLG